MQKRIAVLLFLDMLCMPTRRCIYPHSAPKEYTRAGQPAGRKWHKACMHMLTADSTPYQWCAGQHMDKACRHAPTECLLTGADPAPNSSTPSEARSATLVEDAVDFTNVYVLRGMRARGICVPY
jgi:hypothetical protein